jgi:N-acetylated-alpha-linked acidic dipeptidase
MLKKLLLLLLVLVSFLESSLFTSNLQSWEKIYLSLPSPASARRHLRFYTEKPHMAGTVQDYKTAIYTRDRMLDYGIAAEIVEYEVWLPYPKEILVEITQGNFRASLKEEETAELAFNAYSASADVTAPLVYVNYGLPDDYKKLDQMGVSVKGKIAIARYGRVFRGVKAKVAEERGVAGLLIYSDPSEDGFSRGNVYPRGPYRSPTAVQRGSILYSFLYPGDPLTPGVAATKNARRLTPEEARNLPRIPVQPLSYRDATPLLQALRGPEVPTGWQGSLSFPYHVGPGPLEVRLKIDMDFRLRKIWNVIGEIKGTIEPEKMVILGNHRDAWAYGAVDPNSGSAAMLEVARGLGELLKRGWKPRRTIVLASWDAEEFGLIGSTEWVEENGSRLAKNGVAYINVDIAVSGPNFSISGVPSLSRFAKSVMKDVPHPKSGKSILETWSAQMYFQRALSTGQQDVEPLGRLGSGSDFTPFLQHIGVPALDIGFTGPYGVYHSTYDSFYWMERFGDPDFSYHAALAKLWGLMAMRLAVMPLLPFEYAEYGTQIEKFVEGAERSATEKNLDLDLRELRRAAKDFRETAGRYTEMVANIPSDSSKIGSINERFLKAERALIDPAGLQSRTWYKHIIYAPGFYTGYEAEVLPGLEQAINEKEVSRARLAATQAAQALARASSVLFLPATP